MKKFWSLSIICAVTFAAVVSLPVGRAAAAPASSSWVAFYSQGGEWIAGGVDHLFQSSAAYPITATGSASDVTISVPLPNGDLYSLEFESAPGTTLATGLSVNSAIRAGNPPGSTMTITHGLTTCSPDVTSAFDIEDIAIVNGAVSRLRVALIAQCERGTPLVGEVSYNEPTSGPLTIQADALLFPDGYVGVQSTGIPLKVSNQAATPVAVDQPATRGAAAAEVRITGDTCPPVLAAGASCEITVAMAPAAVGLSQATVTVGSGSATQTIPVAMTGLGGNGAYVVDTSSPTGGPQSLTANQFNSTFAASGSPTLVTVSFFSPSLPVNEGNAYFEAPPGQTLQVGSHLDDPSTFGVSGGPGDCASPNTGQATIRELSYDAEGNLAHFAADIVYTCGSPAAFSAELRVASLIGYSSLATQPDNVTSINFGYVVANSTSPATPVTLTNNGTVAINVNSVIVSGSDASAFAVASNTCTEAALNPGASCTYTVTCTPPGYQDYGYLDNGTASVATVDSTLVGQHGFPLTCDGYPPPSLTSPYDGQTDVDTILPFTWSTPSTQPQGYQLMVGTTPGAANLVNSGVLSATTTSYGVPTMPTDRTLYATLLTEINGTWNYTSTSTFEAEDQAVNFIYPRLIGLNTDPAQPFTWTTNSSVQAYWLVVGTSPGATNVVNSGVLPPTDYYYRPHPLPPNVKLYATLFYETGGKWAYQSIVYTYENVGTAAFTSPLDGQAVTAGVCCSWTLVPGAQGYYLIVGTTRYGSDQANSGVLSPNRTSYTLNELPLGTELFATLYTEVAGEWSRYQSITFWVYYQP